MSREFLTQVEATRKSRLLSISRTNGGQLKIENPPPTNSAGLYWIYTSYSSKELIESSSSQDEGAIDIGSLAKLHDGLSNVCDIEEELECGKKFRLVYNGIAGKSLGIRGRIHQHFNGGKGTGCLSICKSSLKELENWKISYSVLDHDSVAPNTDTSYQTHAKKLERIWRLQFGWPMLCKT